MPNQERNPFRKNFTRVLSFLLVFLFLSGCTTIGFSNPPLRDSLNFGEAQELKFCVYYDPKISQARIESLIAQLKNELLLYKITLLVKHKQEYPRPNFFSVDSLYQLMQEPLPESCDRIMAFFPRNIVDFLLAFPLPEILGVVETQTRTRGLVYADYLTPNLIFGSTPSRVLIHETYHLLGCDHSIVMNECYERILSSKKSNTNGGFFPSLKQDTKSFFLERREVNDLIQSNQK
jgi:hypothetical protein